MTSLINWEALETIPITFECDHIQSDKTFCDEPVRAKLVRKYLREIYRFRLISDWENIEGIEKRKKISTIRYHWFSKKEKAHLYYLYINDEGMDNNMLIFEVESSEHQEELAVIVGLSSGHPYVETPLFNYANSDGSTDNMEIDYKNPKKLFQQLIFYYLLFVQDLIH